MLLVVLDGSTVRLSTFIGRGATLLDDTLARLCASCFCFLELLNERREVLSGHLRAAGEMRLTSGPAAASVDIGADGNALPVPSHAAGGLLKPAPSPHQLLPRCDCGEAVAAEKELFVCRKLPV